MKKIVLILFISFIMTSIILPGCIPSYGASSPQAEWTQDINSSSCDLLDIICGKKCFVASGTNGIVMCSPDGKRWSKIKTGVNGNLNSIVWFKNRFVAVSDTGDIIISRDGINWTVKKPYRSISYEYIYTDNSKVIVTSKQGFVITSSDLNVWKSSQQNMTGICGIEYNGSIYIAISRSTGGIHTSKDGVKWSLCSHKESFSGIICKDGTFYAVYARYEHIDAGYESATYVCSSTNGKEWSESRLTGCAASDLAWDGNTFVFAGNFGYWGFFQGYIMQSSDLINSEAQLIDKCEDFNRIYWNGKQFIAVGFHETIATSKDGIEWESQSSLKPVINDITSNGKIFLATDKNGELLTLKENSKWEIVKTSQKVKYNRVCWSGNMFYACGVYKEGGESVALVSSDGVHWTSQRLFSDLKDVACNGSKQVAVSSDGDRFYSQNGLQWFESLGAYRGGELWRIAWNGKKFVAVGAGIHYSGDGVSWKGTGLNYPARLRDIVWNGNEFVAVGTCLGSNAYNHALVLISKDGIEWIRKEMQTTSGLNSLIWNGTEFLACGNNGIILSSKDGSNWIRQSIGTSEEIVKLSFIRNKMIALTESGNIFYCIKPGHFVGFTPEYLPNRDIKFGFDWKKADVDVTGMTRGTKMASNGKKYVAGTMGGILLSGDKMKWKYIKIYSGLDVTNIVWNGSEFLLAGYLDYGTPDRKPGLAIYASMDGAKWSKRNEITNIKSFNALEANGKAFLILTKYENTNNNPVYISYNGVDWNQTVGLDPDIYTMFFFKSNFYASCHNGLLQSKDGINWTMSEMKPGGQSSFGIISNNKIILAQVGRSIMTSVDRRNWREVCALSQYEFMGRIIWNGQMFIAITDKGNVLTSKDGANWNFDRSIWKSDETKSSGRYVSDYLWNGSSLVVLCTNGDIFYSTSVQ